MVNTAHLYVSSGGLQSLNSSLLLLRVTNQETPKCSPLPSRGGDPVEILVPRDITDPLNLKGDGGAKGEGAGVLLSPLKSRRRHRNRGGGGLPARVIPPTARLTGETPGGQ